MIVGIDFDRVLFDTDRFNEYLKNEIGLEHVDADVRDKNGNYVPAKHAEKCGIDVKDVYKSMEDLENFLYDDIEFLSELDHEFWIVTRGREKFQNAKIEGSGAKEYVERVEIITKGPKDVGIDLLIDDRKEEIERIEADGILFDREKDSLKNVLKGIDSNEA